MDDSVDSLVQEQQRASLEHSLRVYERAFFKGVSPVAGIEVVPNAGFPARYEIAKNIIQLDAGVARFPQLSGLLIVHELAHHKLLLQDPDYANNPYGQPYRDEIKKLCRHDAYIDLR
jgi:hypothetical protein